MKKFSTTGAVITLFCLALSTGCYGGSADDEPLEQTADAIKTGDKFFRNVPGNWNALTHFSCAGTAGPTLRTMTVDGCTITYRDTYCRQVLNETGGWDCVCRSEVMGTSGNCGPVRL